MKKVIFLKVNGIEHSVEVEPRTTLLDLVREQFNLTGASKVEDLVNQDRRQTHRRLVEQQELRFEGAAAAIRPWCERSL